MGWDMRECRIWVVVREWDWAEIAVLTLKM